MLSPQELKAVDNFRFKHRMPSRAAAVRELLRHGIASVGTVVENAGVKSRDYGVLKAPKGGIRTLRSKGRQGGLASWDMTVIVRDGLLGIGHPALDRAAFLTERVSDEHLAKLLTLSYEPMLAWKLDGPIEFWNAGAERLYGFSPGEAIGQSSHAILQTKFPLPLPRVCAQLRDIGQWSGELHHICKDGREVIVDSRMQLLDDTVLEVNRDITDCKQFENALGETEQRLRWLASIVELSDDAIVSKNLDGIVTSWNRGAERIFGHAAAEAIGQPITIVIPEDRQDEERDILTRIRRGERIDHFETVRQRKDGSLIVVSLTVSPVNNAEARSLAHRRSRGTSPSKSAARSVSLLSREKPSTEAKTCWQACRLQ